MDVLTVRENNGRYALEIERGRLFSQVVTIKKRKIVIAKIVAEDLDRLWPVTKRPEATPAHCAQIWLNSTLRKTERVVAVLNEIRGGRIQMNWLPEPPKPQVKPPKEKTKIMVATSNKRSVGKPREDNKYCVTRKNHNLQSASTRRRVYDAINSAGKTGVYRSTVEKKLKLDNALQYILKLVESGYVRQM